MHGFRREHGGPFDRGRSHLNDGITRGQSARLHEFAVFPETHHLAHDNACWAFIESFLAATLGPPVARWIDAPAAFGLDR